ncbi:MAG: hypothetical protein CL942_04270 [Desulfovibrio sp.]|nr:hypothetical protein [Desulfovibrio sp.]|tara:strand:+ start:64393 stop:66624 length:2232 start_codon:yes stop_codon:yes gene_type:complete
MPEEKNLPIKVVPPLEGDYFVPDNTGGSSKIFEEPTAEFRENLFKQIQGVANHFRDSFERQPNVPAVARIKLRPEAVAKSHRPTRILSELTCPIIGAEGLGRLLVSVSPNGLFNLAEKVRTDTTIQGRANLSTLTEIAPYNPPVDIPKDLNQPIKVKLFRHRLNEPDNVLEWAFVRMLEQLEGVQFKEVEYGGGLKIYRISKRGPGVVEALSRFVGTQSVGSFPKFSPVRTQARQIGMADQVQFPPPEQGVDYPIVGIVDSGINPNDPYLAPWVIGRETYIPTGLQNNSHGTFVAGLLVNSCRLNHGDARFPTCSAKLVDVVALSDQIGTSEDDLIELLKDAIPKYPDVKIWNLSLGGDATVSDDMFSDLAIALDELQERHEVQFVLAGGNVNDIPLREWPLSNGGRASDRIRTPADSVRSVVVGAIAHLQNASSAAPSECPSPFSRVGPGPVYIPKPDISHYGGNCNVNGDYSQTGVVSLGEQGALVENVGTSFAAPLISTLTANVSMNVAGGASHNLTKALMVHSAAWKTAVKKSEELHYRGFGTPPDLSDILSCEPWKCTLIFELPIVSGRTYKKFDFPVPPSLVHDGLLKASFLMTLVYDPALDASHGSEYCRTNVEASLGTLQPNGDGTFGHKRQVPEDPRLKGKAYEKDLVRHGFKWSPVKVYRRNIVRMEHRHRWSLAINMTHRAGVVDVKRQPVALMITVADPNKEAPVYNEMVREMNRLNWGAYDLPLTHRLRL